MGFFLFAAEAEFSEKNIRKVEETNMICTIAEEYGFTSCMELPALQQMLTVRIQELYAQGYTQFLLNCERGIPLIAARIICKLKSERDIGLHIIVPFEEQTTHWSHPERAMYFSIHEQADSIRYASRSFRPDCYKMADKLMTEESDHVVIYGTDRADIALYAKEKGISTEFPELPGKA